jgi:hypothetical protein
MDASLGSKSSYSALLLFLIAAGECGQNRTSQACKRILNMHFYCLFLWLHYNDAPAPGVNQRLMEHIAVVIRSRGHKAVWKLTKRIECIWTLLLRITWLHMELHFTVWISVGKQHTVCNNWEFPSNFQRVQHNVFGPGQGWWNFWNRKPKLRIICWEILSCVET